MVNRLTLVFLAAVLIPWSCATTSGSWETLPSAEQRAFQHCQNAITLRECPPVPGATDEHECISAARAVYAGMSEPAERRRWLAAHGCSRTGVMSP
jgi:hypothetical protein